MELELDGCKTRGVNYRHLRRYVETSHGAGAWIELLSTVDDSEVKLAHNANSVDWYPLGLYARLMDALDKKYGAGAGLELKRFGSYVAEQDLTSVLRTLLQLTSPSLVLKGLTFIWTRYYDRGDWRLDPIPEGGVMGILEGWVSSETMCTEIVAYMQRTLEIVGARMVRVTHPECVGRRDGRCVYECRWKKM